MRNQVTSAAVASVLLRLGIDPRRRFDEFDQDCEYTACAVEELDQYFNLYVKESRLSQSERDVLACFMFECLNDLAYQGQEHPLQEQIISLLMSHPEFRGELEYWMNTNDVEEDNWCPLTKVLLKHAMRIHGEELR